MDKVRFLFDECVSHRLVEALLRAEPSIEFLIVGEEGAPPKKTPDLVLLEFAEAEKRLFVSFDKKTLPGHLQEHYAKGRHTYGVIAMKRYVAFGSLLEELLFIWMASTADEWIDYYDVVPPGN